MKYTFREILIVLLILSFQFSKARDFKQQEKWKNEIIKCIEIEDKAFAMRDYETWKKYWVQTEELKFLTTGAHEYKNIMGWRKFDNGVQGEFQREPSKNYSFNKYDFDIQSDGKMAMVSFETFWGYNADGSKRNTVKQFNVMVKEGEFWKYLYVHQVIHSSYKEIMD